MVIDYDRISDLFLHEDFGSTENKRPENRVNISLFSILQHDWFRFWLLGKFGLPQDSIVYPSTGQNSVRPDLKVAHPCNSDDTRAWIEVELSRDQVQLSGYKEKLVEPVKSLWGKRCDGGDLSLEEVAEFLATQSPSTPQVAANVEQLIKLINSGLDGYAKNTRRANVSDFMRDHPLVRELEGRLGDRIRFDLEGKQPRPGELKADSMDTPDNRGFSLRVFAPGTGDNTLSILSISGGRDSVNFPSLPKLERYFTKNREQIAEYGEALDQIGVDIGQFNFAQRPSIPLSSVVTEEALDLLVPCIVALAKCYGDSVTALGRKNT